MTILEEAVLESKDPSIENWDDWPTYSLKKIYIYTKESKEPVSLLQAHKDHSVNIIGHLEPIDADQSHLSISHLAIGQLQLLIKIFI